MRSNDQLVQEQFVAIDGHRVWTRRVGATSRPERLPVVLLHGGPGVPSDYLEPLEQLAADGREVIRYDQLGCGRSDHPDDPALLQVERFVNELALVRAALGLERIHLYGQSWGGMLALEAALAGAPGIASLVLSNAPASMPLWVAETTRLRRELPAEVQRVLDEHEQAGTTDSPEYQEAMMAFYRRHVCRLDPWPECLLRSFTAMEEDPRVYQAMCGPSEFHITGSLRDWDVSDRLGEIQQPTLVIGGRFDEATPAVTEALHRGIPHSEWVLLDECSHLSHLEQPAVYCDLLGDFLRRVETGDR
ncbi:MAG: proline iminopeptidase-family hydrolase [Cyanobacteriota bacterium]|jgi:L-proline amide hydrolase